jgi:hypothetical protein
MLLSPFRNIMAPEKSEEKRCDRFVKETLLFKHCKKGTIPGSFTSLHACERNFGFKYHVKTVN